MPRLQEPSFLVLTALAAGPQHGYGVIKDVQSLSSGQVTLRVGTLYGALDRLTSDGLVTPDHDEVVDSRLRRPHPADVLNLSGAIVQVWWRLLWRWARPRFALLGVAAVLVTALVVAVLPARPGVRVEAGRPAGLPQRFAGYSDATGSVSDAPPGRAIALYQQGSEPARNIVLSADRDAYRQLDLATAHRTGDPGGAPAPALLSPDGGHAAVGYYQTKTPEVSIQDLTTGEEVTHTVGIPAGEWGAGAVPMAWSATATGSPWSSHPRSTGRGSTPGR